MPLTPEAQAAIDEAVRIVREDRREAMLKAMHDKVMSAQSATPPTDPAGPPAPPVTPPPDPNGPPPAPKRDAYWGELLS